MLASKFAGAAERKATPACSIRSVEFGRHFFLPNVSLFHPDVEFSAPIEIPVLETITRAFSTHLRHRVLGRVRRHKVRDRGPEGAVQPEVVVGDEVGQARVGALEVRPLDGQRRALRAAIAARTET